MPHLADKPQHFFKSPKDKSVHRHTKAKNKALDRMKEVRKRISKSEPWSPSSQ